jgi:hypothetical protein
MAWLDRFIAAPFDDLILLTGEGVYRLRDIARPAGAEAAFPAALGQTRTINRGPKPVRALRALGLQPQLRGLPQSRQRPSLLMERGTRRQTRPSGDTYAELLDDLMRMLQDAREWQPVVLDDLRVDMQFERAVVKDTARRGFE